MRNLQPPKRIPLKREKSARIGGEIRADLRENTLRNTLKREKVFSVLFTFMPLGVCQVLVDWLGQIIFLTDEA